MCVAAGAIIGRGTRMMVRDTSTSLSTLKIEARKYISFELPALDNKASRTGILVLAILVLVILV